MATTPQHPAPPKPPTPPPPPKPDNDKKATADLDLERNEKETPDKPPPDETEPGPDNPPTAADRHPLGVGDVNDRLIALEARLIAAEVRIEKIDPTPAPAPGTRRLGAKKAA